MRVTVVKEMARKKHVQNCLLCCYILNILTTSRTSQAISPSCLRQLSSWISFVFVTTAAPDLGLVATKGHKKRYPAASFLVRDLDCDDLWLPRWFCQFQLFVIHVLKFHSLPVWCQYQASHRASGVISRVWYHGASSAPNHSRQNLPTWDGFLLKEVFLDHDLSRLRNILFSSCKHLTSICEQICRKVQQNCMNLTGFCQIICDLLSALVA